MSDQNTVTIHLTVDPITFDSAEAELESVKLSASNIQMLKNLLSSCLNELVMIQPENGDLVKYSNQVAFLRGQISAYSHLIQQHDQSYLEN